MLTPSGQLDEDTLAPLEREIEAAVTRHGGLILDASDITFSDSVFLQLVVATHQRARLHIAAPPTAMRRIFSITGADMVLRIHPTLESALAACAQSPPLAEA